MLLYSRLSCGGGLHAQLRGSGAARPDTQCGNFARRWGGGEGGFPWQQQHQQWPEQTRRYRHFERQRVRFSTRSPLRSRFVRRGSSAPFWFIYLPGCTLPAAVNTCTRPQRREEERRGEEEEEEGGGAPRETNPSSVRCLDANPP